MRTIKITWEDWLIIQKFMNWQSIQKDDVYLNLDMIFSILERISNTPNVYSVEIHIDAISSIYSDESFETPGTSLENITDVILKFLKWYDKQ